MRTHDYLMRTSYDYRESQSKANSASKNAATYREKYLALRKLIREEYKANGLVPGAEIAKAIGWKD